MITKAQFLDLCSQEFRVIRHLLKKVPANAHDWRPTPAQRSTIELARYLTTAAIVPVRATIARSWDGAEEAERASDSLAWAEVDGALVREEAALRETLAPFSERDLLDRDATLPWGQPAKLGAALVVTALETLVAYRMQLFLHAKQSGNASIGPSDCWAGVSRPERATSAT